MKKNSLYTVIFGIFAILIIGIFISIFIFVTQHRQDLIETTINEKVVLVSSINEITSSSFLLWFYRTASVGGIEEAFVKEMAKSKDTRFIRIVNKEGDIKQSTIEGEKATIMDDPDIGQALSSKKFILRDEVFNGEEIKVIIYPGYSAQTIWIGFSLDTVERMAKSMLIRDISINLGILALIILAMFLVLRNSIINPIKKITLACKEIGRNNLDVRIDVKSKNEIGEFVETFNKMLEDLKKSNTALEESKNVLEIKVKARTKELSELAAGLEENIKERTKELQGRVNELERFHRLTVGRETKMIELKKKIRELKGEPPKGDDVKKTIAKLQ